MSTKLNAKELAKRDVMKYVHATSYQVAATEGYITAVEKVAQPIADERDGLWEALEQVTNLVSGVRNRGTLPENLDKAINIGRDILAKYPKS
jgi:hypothetical protein